MLPEIDPAVGDPTGRCTALRRSADGRRERGLRTGALRTPYRRAADPRQSRQKPAGGAGADSTNAGIECRSPSDPIDGSKGARDVEKESGAVLPRHHLRQWRYASSCTPPRSRRWSPVPRDHMTLNGSEAGNDTPVELYGLCPWSSRCPRCLKLLFRPSPPMISGFISRVSSSSTRQRDRGGRRSRVRSVARPR